MIQMARISLGDTAFEQKAPAGIFFQTRRDTVPPACLQSIAVLLIIMLRAQVLNRKESWSCSGKSAPGTNLCCVALCTSICCRECRIP